jgi:hypothetical protein
MPPDPPVIKATCPARFAGPLKCCAMYLYLLTGK